jgi:hypothetical protein
LKGTAFGRKVEPIRGFYLFGPFPCYNFQLPLKPYSDVVTDIPNHLYRSDRCPAICKATEPWIGALCVNKWRMLLLFVAPIPRNTNSA